MRLADIRHVVLDMDGTIYLGGTLFEATLPFLQLLRDLSVGYTFVTNNNSRSRDQYIAHLHEMGIAADSEAIFSSAHATIHHLQSKLPQVRRLYVVGTKGLLRDLELAGFEIVQADPEAVIVGFDNTLTYDRLAQASYWIAQGLPYIATHPDRICPTDQPIVLPDCGAICALLETATGRKPDMIPGKPSRLMLQGVMDRERLAPEQIAMVGDRVYTDMRMAKDAGALAVLTLTGETTQAALDALPKSEQPDLVVTGLDDLGRRLSTALGGGNKS